MLLSQTSSDSAVFSLAPCRSSLHTAPCDSPESRQLSLLWLRVCRCGRYFQGLEVKRLQDGLALCLTGRPLDRQLDPSLTSLAPALPLFSSSSVQAGWGDGNCRPKEIHIYLRILSYVPALQTPASYTAINLVVHFI